MIQSGRSRFGEIQCALLVVAGRESWWEREANGGEVTPVNRTSFQTKRRHLKHLHSEAHSGVCVRVCFTLRVV